MVYRDNAKDSESHDHATIYIDVFVLTILLASAALLAGLTIGLMSLTPSTLELLKKTGTPSERECAKLVEPLRKQTHLLLCTLLLANTVINETLPILLEPLLGGGWKAVLCSTVLVLILGEIIPQAICSRYGLYIGAKFSWIVRGLMVILYPFAYPIAKLLDLFLGDSHTVSYHRSQLKELVQMHKQVLHPEEAQILGGVLDLRDKKVSDIMIPLKNVFALDWDSLVDRALIERIVSRGYSRVPVYQNHRSNLVGVVLVKNLLLLKQIYPVNRLPLAPLIIISSQMNLFEVFSIFQKGRSHLASVTTHLNFSLGIVTLEDIFEEMIGNDIVDETDSLNQCEFGTDSRMSIFSYPADLLDSPSSPLSESNSQFFPSRPRSPPRPITQRSNSKNYYHLLDPPQLTQPSKSTLLQDFCQHHGLTKHIQKLDHELQD